MHQKLMSLINEFITLALIIWVALIVFDVIKIRSTKPPILSSKPIKIFVLLMILFFAVKIILTLCFED